MGKKNKPTVSIVTITQIKRQDTIQITAELIKNQTYKNILEWVIVEGSKNLEDCIANEQFIKTLCSDVTIVYVPGHTENVFNDNKLGELRNISNKTAKGQIIVCMDDDDYYPPTRVEHAVSMLVTSKSEIAGCSQKYLYDYCLERLFKFKQFGPFHSTNDCFAYKRSYFENNVYDSSACMAEESSFTKKFTNPMVQLDPKHCIIGSSHFQNTFNKKEICITGCLYKNPEKPEEGYMYPNIIHPEETVQEIMGDTFFKKYCDVFRKPIESEYDIVYFCGGTSVEWDPSSRSLGGSEQAVVHLCSEFVKMGKRVAVYAKITKETTFHGIDFIDWKKFPFHKHHKIVVLWRMSGINCGLLFPIKTDKLFVDYHDNNFVFRHAYLPYTHKIDRIFFKSDFHLEYYQNHFKQDLPKEQFAIIPNGLRMGDFMENPGVQREPYRFCYCSCYTRGLVELLANVWPMIHHYEPRAELHVYYGMDGIQDPQARQQITLLMGQPGVMDHGRRPVEEISKEKWRSSFHLYVTDCVGEIDCISIRESLVTGCLPLLSNSGVFKKRDGIHFDLDKTPQGYQKIAQGILNVLSKPEFVEMCRQRFRQSPTVLNWESVAKQWGSYLMSESPTIGLQHTNGSVL